MIDLHDNALASPGRALGEARRAQGLSLEDCSERTKIPVTSLRALEHDNWALLPAPIYVKGFLKAYAAELGQEPQPILDAWRALGGENPSPLIRSHTRIDALDDVRQPSHVPGVIAGLAVGAAVIMIWLFGVSEGPAVVSDPDAGRNNVPSIQDVTTDPGLEVRDDVRR